VNTTAWKLLAELLQLASDELGNLPDDTIYIESSIENRALLTMMARNNRYLLREETEEGIGISLHIALEYFAKLATELSGQDV